jgi:hypothetical protein
MSTCLRAHILIIWRTSTERATCSVSSAVWQYYSTDQCHAYVQCVASDATTQPKVADFGHPRDANKNIPCGKVAVNEVVVGHVNHSGEHVMQHTECLKIKSNHN